MKKYFTHIIFALVLLFGAESLCHGQYVNNFDSGIYAIRANDFPSFNYTYDDYLQYSPAGVMFAMKVCGVESRSSWSRMVVSDVFSVGLMATAVYGLKYTIQRPRPDVSENLSFPSGHAAKSFMAATMLHKEYGWRSPWISIGGYTVAAATGVSRLLNNRHWMTDVVAGAAIGIGSVHLGYYLTDLIFKDKGLSDSYESPSFSYDTEAKHYVAELSFGHRKFFSSESAPEHGGVVSLSSDIPIIPSVGITVRGCANSLIYKDERVSDNMYSAGVGAYWNFFYAKRFEFQTHALVGGASYKEDPGSSTRTGIDFSAGLGISLMLDSNFKLKIFTDYETVSSPSGKPWLNSIVLGWSSAWFW